MVGNFNLIFTAIFAFPHCIHMYDQKYITNILKNQTGMEIKSWTFENITVKRKDLVKNLMYKMLPLYIGFGKYIPAHIFVFIYLFT